MTSYTPPSLIAAIPGMFGSIAVGGVAVKHGIHPVWAVTYGVIPMIAAVGCCAVAELGLVGWAERLLGPFDRIVNGVADRGQALLQPLFDFCGRKDAAPLVLRALIFIGASLCVISGSCAMVLCVLALSPLVGASVGAAVGAVLGAPDLLALCGMTLGLGVDGYLVGRVVNDSPRSTANGDVIFQQGRAARRAGLLKDACPEPPGDGRGMWMLGWNAEDRDIVRSAKQDHAVG